MRDLKIDILRFIGLAAIILAHTNPPLIIFQLRNFDVPLMVFISGLSFSISYKKEDFLSYLIKRMKRLVLPVWIFLSVYFGVQLISGIYIESLSLRKIISSFLFFDGIGYVWIIRIFLIMAIVAPFIYRLNESLKDNNFFVLVIIMLCASEIAMHYFLSLDMIGRDSVLGQFLWYVVPYSILLSIGMRSVKLTITHQTTLLLISLVIFLGIAVLMYIRDGHFVPTQAFKYPPRLYYLSYAVFIIFLIYLILEPLKNMISRNSALSRSIAFISQNSIWIYLWHIPFIKVINTTFEQKYLYTSIAAVVITRAQVFLVDYFCSQDKVSPHIKKNVKIMLTG